MSEEHHRHAADTRWKKSLRVVGRIGHVFTSAFGAALKAMSGVGGNAPLTPPDQSAGQRREDYRP